MSLLTELSLFQAAESLRKGEISSCALTEAYFERITAYNGQLNAYLTLSPELALQQAQEADRLLSAWRKEPGRPISPVLGIPLAVKDVLCVAGVRCTCGSLILENFVPPYHATVVERLISAGMVPLGKTNTDEFAMGSSTENSAYGVTHNPWDPTRVPGGSSGGSAAAVAARLAPVALGTDTGGSVRQPAAFCGVTGLKPTYGRVSRYGLVAYGSSLDVVGVLGTAVDEVVALYTIIAGPDPLDATSQDQLLPELKLKNLAGVEQPLRGKRIGVPNEYFIPGLQPDVESGVQQAIQTLASLGAEIQPVSMPHTEYALPVYYLIAPAEASANLARYDGIRYGSRHTADNLVDVYRNTRGAGFGAEVKRRIMLGTYALSAGYYDAFYGQAQKVRTLIKRDFEMAFEQVDLIAAPVTPTTAFKIGEHGDDPLSMYLEDIFTLPANLAGVPAISFPVGFDEHRLPIGIQLMAAHWNEDQLFQAVYAYQLATNWHQAQPEI